MTETSDPPRADATRARLLAAAVSTFAAKGFHATTTRDIAAAAGMSPAALYVHHRSKEELLYLIARGGHERTLARLRAGVASSSDPVEQVRRVIRDFAVFHARDHTTARVVHYELAALSPEHLAEIRAIRQITDGEIRRLVERGVAAGVFDIVDPAMAATALLSLGIDIARWYRDDGGWTPEDIGDRYAELALRMLGLRPAHDAV
ncbi:TetR family transcriptional regulator [Frankia sp. CNm7]|uniref:TetR family transcriptional regulator n=1 Tax=Frankia nepalensis TaxID=1836974 RepID=A0A937RNS4_9ACTN|nr:TetR family transcriptional regulator [Frankia nepalensis]MBL7501989.1 TetR family transcriptional regulator [Frankia nepalensis]MBL7510619.1 TetR family transcriptional regulator [Frankia nepalensis]MBL7517359.1 TetR family transcriptional regulator [Frankia nepalensis]MBL7633442.1 TetR family transcriptional regulator [Frankia nepalensis]